MPMIVSELITKLTALPQDSGVYVYVGDGDFWGVVKDVEIDPESQRVFLYGEYAIALRKDG